MRGKSFLANSILVLVSITISYIGLESAYRVYLFKRIHDQVTDRLVGVTQQDDKDRWLFDPLTGYRYTPNKSWEFNTKEIQARWSVNEHGLIANDIDPSPYPVQKPDDEYRIALLGDSFAAGVANYLRMSDLVQDYLNRSLVWRDFVGGKFTRVLNFGMDGTGFVQFGANYEFNARRFSPDLVIVNYITDDVMRRFAYRGGTQIPVDELRPYIAARVRNDMWSGMSWLGSYPELLADTALGRLLGMQPRLTAAAAMNADEDHFHEQSEGIRSALTSLERIRCLNPRLLVFNQQEYEELMIPIDGPQGLPPYERYLSSKFIAAAAADGFSIVNLAQLYQSPTDALRIEGLFNFDVDEHDSDYGTFVYASWLTNFLLNWSRTAAAREPAVPVSCR